MARLKNFSELYLKKDKDLPNLKIPAQGPKGTPKYSRMKIAYTDAPGTSDIKKAIKAEAIVDPNDLKGRPKKADPNPESPYGIKHPLHPANLKKKKAKSEASSPSVLKPTKPSDITKHARTLAKNSDDYERNKKKYIDKARSKVFKMYPRESLNGLMKEESVDEATWPDEMPNEDVDVDEEGDIEIEDEEDVEVEVAEAKEEVDEGDDEMYEVKKDLDEAMATIETLKSELNEINLLNAKLLYTNKVFRGKNLTEAQKVKVLGAFDKAETVKEVKLVFETLNSSVKAKAVNRSITEGVRAKGSASNLTAAPKATKKQPIVESNEMVNRFKKLAGLI